MSLAEFRKMLTDHQITSSMLNREELATLFRLINIKQDKSTLVTLTYEGFIEAIVQISIFIFSQPKKGFSQLPFIEMVKELMTKFKDADIAKGENTVLYFDPDATSLVAADHEIIQDLNKKIEQFPNEPLPDGYKKVVEKEMKFVYSVQEHLLPKKEELRVCCEILDDLLFEKFEIHFIEQFARIEDKPRVRQKKNLIPRPKKTPSATAQNRKEEAKKPPIERKNKMSPKIKLLVAQLPAELQKCGEEVGAVLEDVLKAVVAGQTEILPSGAAKEKNKNIVQRKIAEEESKRIEEEREKKRKERQKELKQKLEEIKKSAAENEEKKKIEEEEKQKKAKEKEKRIFEQRKKEIAERMQKLEEERRKKEEEKLKGKAEADQLTKEEKEKKDKEREAFLKKKTDEMVML